MSACLATIDIFVPIAMNQKSDIFKKFEASLLQFQRSIRHHEASWQKVSKLNLLETMILRFIIFEGPKKMKDVSSRFEIKLSTLTSVIDKLEKSNLLIRKHTDNDRRVILLHASKKGKKLFETYRKFLAERLIQLKTILSEKQYSHFGDAIHSFHFAIADSLIDSES